MRAAFQWAAAAVLTLFVAAWAEPARAQTLRFKGATTVDEIVARDALLQIRNIAMAKFNCSVLSAVEAQVLPASYQPAETDNYAIGGRETYERWDVTLCGRRVPFLLGFWPAKEGGTMFHVRHPFPPAAKPIRPKGRS